MSEPRWLDEALLLALYDDVVVASGGAAGVRDEGLVESAIARAQNRYAYESVTSLLDLAATYAVAISGNHPFVDGNKRMAFMALGLFLEDNGLSLTASKTRPRRCSQSRAMLSAWMNLPPGWQALPARSFS